MSLFIEVYVGQKPHRKLVAESVAHNISGLADISSYQFGSDEFGDTRLGIPENFVEGEIKDHPRRSSVWSLVEKIAKQSKLKGSE